MKRVAAMVLVGAALVAACAADDPVQASIDRPPLGSPPDPGPVPSDDGFTDPEREAIVADTVRISGVACGRAVEGSGFAVGEDLVATNAHVLLGVEDLAVETVDGRLLEARTVAWDGYDDLAVLEVPGLELEAFELGDAPDGTVGTIVGWEDEGLPQPVPFRIDRPILVRIDEVAGDARVERKSWLVAADIDFGYSGAALVDHDGVVVGVAYATTRRNAGVAYAVRSSQLESLLADADLESEVMPPGCR